MFLVPFQMHLSILFVERYVCLEGGTEALGLGPLTIGSLVGNIGCLSKNCLALHCKVLYSTVITALSLPLTVLLAMTKIIGN